MSHYHGKHGKGMHHQASSYASNYDAHGWVEGITSLKVTLPRAQRVTRQRQQDARAQGSVLIPLCVCLQAEDRAVELLADEPSRVAPDAGNRAAMTDGQVYSLVVQRLYRCSGIRQCVSYLKSKFLC